MNTLTRQSRRKVVGLVVPASPLQEMQRRLDALSCMPSATTRRVIGEDVARTCGVGLDSVNDAWERALESQS